MAWATARSGSCRAASSSGCSWPGRIIADPVLLLLDEPTSGVDIRTRDEVLHLLADLNAQGVTIVLTTHELNSVAAHLPHVVCVNRTDRGPG